jgi:hypothetical protein
MAAVERVGLEAIFDLSKWTPEVNTFLRDVKRVNDGLTEGSASASRFGTAFQAGVGAAIGSATIGLVGAFVSELQQLGGQVIETVTFFERLGIATQFFVAREKVAADETLNFSTALSQSAEEAQGLLLWQRRLAILSPFTSKDVGRIFQVVPPLDVPTKSCCD